MADDVTTLVEDEGIDGNDGGIVDVISNEQIAALFGVQEALGCGATLEEYTNWYNSLGIITEQEVDIELMEQVQENLGEV